MKKRRYVVFAGVFILLSVLAIIRNHRIIGQPVGDAPVQLSADTASVINTYNLAQDVMGYGGPLPINIYLTGERIDSVEILPNSETPGFLARLYDEGLVEAWNGKTLSESDTMRVDAVSGATFSSNALIANVHAGVADGLQKHKEGKKFLPATGGELWKWIFALLVILLAGVIPFFTKKAAYRAIQQLLNVGILGFWAGTFVDYAMMLNFFSNLVQFTLAGIVTVALMIIVFIYPLFGSKDHYCNWICPYGSLQDLAGRINKKKVRMSTSLVKGLQMFRRVLWAILIILLATGFGASWVDYEIFTAFIVESASWIVIGIGILFILLSIFIPRPFCRFVCPTGTLIKSF